MSSKPLFLTDTDIDVNVSLESENAILYQENQRLHEENLRYKSKNLALLKKVKQLTDEKRDLENKLANVTLWDLSPEAQEEAGHALAKSLLGR